MAADDAIAGGPKRVVDDVVALGGFGPKENTTQLRQGHLILI